MKIKLLLFISVLLHLYCIAWTQTPPLEWARGLSSSGSIDGVYTVVASNGDVIIAGGFKTTTDFDLGPSTFTLTPANGVGAGFTDIFVARYSSSGTFLWAKKIGGNYDDVALNVKLDNQENIIICGNFFGTADFNPGTAVNNLISGGALEAYVCKLTSNGDYLWARKFGSTGDDDAFGIAVDQQNNVYTVGYFNGTVDFDPGTPVVNLVSAGGGDAFISKLNSNGNFVWARRIGAATAEMANTVTIDLLNNVLVAGSFFNTVDFDPGSGTANMTAYDVGQTGFLLKLSDAGNYMWSRMLGAYGTSNGTAIGVDINNDIIFGGSCSGLVNMNTDGLPLNYQTSTGSSDAFLVKLTASGAYVHSRMMGGSGFDQVNGLIVDGAGNYYATGPFSGTIQLAAPLTTFNLTSQAPDAYLVKYNANGDCQWGFRLGSTSNDFGRSFSADFNGGAIIGAGRFTGTVDADPGPAVSNISTQVSNIFGSYLTRYTEPIVMPATNLQIKFLVQGYYIGSSTMSPVLFNQEVPATPTNLCDNVTIELRNPNPPYALEHTINTTVSTNGIANASLPLNNSYGKSYYIVVKHRNSINVWSSLPITLSGTNVYDFTTSASKAFADGIGNTPMVEVEPGVWALWSGDIDQDGYIDLLDYNAFDVIYQNGYPYSNTTPDLDGNGYVELDDYNIWDVSYQNPLSIYAQMP